MEEPRAAVTVSGRRSLDEFFSSSVRKHPDRPALAVRGKSWSYAALDTQCRAIERALRAAGLEQGGHRVGVVFAKGVLSYASVIAIMRTNNVYVPLNSKIPAERLVRMLDDAGIEVVIVDTDEPLSEGVEGALARSRPLKVLAGEDHTKVSLDLLSQRHRHQVWNLPAAVLPPQPEQPHSLPPVDPATPARPSEAPTLAYLMYTSGSTGTPKGIAITHESACRCIEKSHRLFETHERDRFTQFSALSFDVSILDLFLCWKSGAALHVPEPAEGLVPLKFTVSHEITVWSSVPSLSNFMLKLGLLKSNALPHIRLSLFCGEALPSELAQAWTTAAPRSRVINLYGPTESTIFAAYHEYSRASATTEAIVPIGKPLEGMHCLIVDDGRVVDQDDVPGELWLSGDQLAGGYWNNPAATHAAFVQPPTELPQAPIWYRTGDLVSRRNDRTLSFRGRVDRQVKLRGFRVELQEIESALREIVGCTLVAVIPVRNTGGICEQIIAYCDKLNADEATLKERCGRRIPRYMVPDRIIELETFPTGTSGKIDYLALAARSAGRSGEIVKS
jgi:amino acid adenylation domain-containing protein